MPYFPIVPENRMSQQVTDIFMGYNHNLKIADGEFYEMENMTSAYFPLLANRGRRGYVTDLDEPQGFLAKSQLAYVDGSNLIYGGQDLTTYINAAGFFISTDEKMCPKQLVSMGAYIIIYPDRLYINTENYTDCGSIDAVFSTASGSAVSFSICSQDGDTYERVFAGATAPEAPENGALWLDASSSVHTLKQYNDGTGTWVQMPTVYTKISYPGIGKAFNQFDGVQISGCMAPNDAMADQVEALNGYKIIYAKDDNFIVVIGILDQSFTQEIGSIRIERSMPTLDFITEAENRLWGCRYGLVNGETVNEIYCCSLGDFKNWNQFLGLSTDSWRASVGTDGAWTGAVTHNGYPIFFKENCLHKVYISSAGAHQIDDKACRGVQKGSHNSLVVVNETLYYKGVTDICAYDGSLPVSVSAVMGGERYYNAAAGSIGDKYYVSMQDAAGIWHMFVYDTSRNFWHREDNTHALCFARCHGDLYYIDADLNKLICTGGSEGEPEDPVTWSATTGLIGYNYVEQKYVSRFNLRMKLPVGSWVKMLIEYDSDGEWLEVGYMEGVGTRTFMLPVRPRRCDHFRFRIEGQGDVRVYSLAKIHESGSDEQWQ